METNLPSNPPKDNVTTEMSKATAAAVAAARIKFVAGHESLRNFPPYLQIQLDQFYLNPPLYRGRPAKSAVEYAQFLGLWGNIWLIFVCPEGFQFSAWAVYRYGEKNWIFVVQRNPKTSSEVSMSHTTKAAIIVPDPDSENDALIEISSNKRRWMIWQPNAMGKVRLHSFMFQPGDTKAGDARRPSYVQYCDGTVLSIPGSFQRASNSTRGQVGCAATTAIDTVGAPSTVSRPGKCSEPSRLPANTPRSKPHLFVTLKYGSPPSRRSSMSASSLQSESTVVPEVIYTEKPHSKRLSSYDPYLPESKKARYKDAKPTDAKDRSLLGRSDHRKEITENGSIKNGTNLHSSANDSVHDELQVIQSKTDPALLSTNPPGSKQEAYAATATSNGQAGSTTSTTPDSVVPSLSFQARSDLGSTESKNEESSSADLELSNRPVIFHFKHSTTDPKPRVRPNAVVNNMSRLFMHASCSKILAREGEMLSVQIGDDPDQRFNIMKDDEEDYLRIVKALNKQQNGSSNPLVVTVMPAEI